jgi:hypothetical protein
MTLYQMSRARANEILDLWKRGVEDFPERIILAALFVTGDLEQQR